MWKIKHIFDGDYGCEERNPNEAPKVSVTLINEDNICRGSVAYREQLR